MSPTLGNEGSSEPNVRPRSVSQPRMNVFTGLGQTDQGRRSDGAETTPSGGGSGVVGGVIEGIRQGVTSIIGGATNVEGRGTVSVTPDRREELHAHDSRFAEDSRETQFQLMYNQMSRALRETQLELSRLREAREEVITGARGGSVAATQIPQAQEVKIFDNGAPIARITGADLTAIRDTTRIYNSIGSPRWGVPKNKDMVLALAKFSAKETYKGLGCGVEAWMERFVRKLERAQLSTEFFWKEDVKLDTLEMHLEGKALDYWQIQRREWGNTTLVYAMNCMKANYRSTLSSRQAMAIFDREKPAYRGYKEHLNYLMQVNEAGGGKFKENVLMSIVHRAGPDLMHEISCKYDRNRTDYITHATELVDYAEDLWNNRNLNKNTGKKSREEEANMVETKKVEKRKCFNCNKTGHISRDCKAPKKDTKKSYEDKKKDKKSNEDFVFSVVCGDETCTEVEVENCANTIEGENSIVWILDSGCSRNFTGNPRLLGPDAKGAETRLILPDGTRAKSTRRGSIAMTTEVKGIINRVTVENVEYVPGFKRNLLSYVNLERKGIRLVYEGNKRYLVRTATDTKVAEVQSEGDILTVHGELSGAMANANLVCSVIESQEHVTEAAHEDTLFNWHKRLGHQSYEAIEVLASKPGSGIKLTDTKKPHCLTCSEGKQTKNRQSKKDTGENSPIDRIGGVICSDLKGPITPADREKNRYLVNFIDHKTNYCRIFLAKTKDEAAKKFMHFVGHFERRFDCKIQVLRTDGGGEYVNVDLFCEKTGIARQRTEADNPASNGKAERMHRTVLNMARCMIFNCKLPMHFWGDAVKYAAYVLNRSPCKSNPRRMSPLEMLEGKPPSLTNVVIFGSPCMVYRSPGKNSLKKRSQRALVLGVSEEVKGYRVYLMVDKKVITTQHVKHIDTLSSAQNFSLLSTDADAVDQGTDQPLDHHVTDGSAGGANQRSTAAPAEVSRMATRPADKRKKSKRAEGSYIVELDDEDAYLNEDENEDAVVECNAVEGIDPPNYSAAMKTPEADKWKIAIENELKSLRDNRTWVVVDKPENVKPLQSRLVFKLKLNANGGVERYKARLVARGDQQIEGVNYQETFSPVMDMATVRVIFAFGVIWGNPPRHGDIPVAYTRASPEEDLDIYMYPPQGMQLTADEAASGGRKPVLKLTKNIYGLKQAGRLWNQMLDQKLRALKYKQSSVDTCLYYKFIKSTIILVGVYVDDLLVTSNNAALVDEFFEDMKAFDVKDLGVVEQFLGLKVEHETGAGYILSQQTMVTKLIKSFGMQDSKPVNTPTTEADPLDEDSELLSPEETAQFRTMAGGLLWITRCSRPDIAYAVHKMTRRTHAPRVCDMKMGKRILRYLNGSSAYRLKVMKDAEGTPLQIQVYTDADWAGEAKDRKSINAALTFLNGMIISWTCNKQTAVALSTMESEFVSAARGVQDALACFHILEELKQSVELPFSLFMDNQAAITSVMNESSSSKTKHVDIRHKFIKDYYQKGYLMPKYVPTTNMKADILTKNMPGPTFERLRSLIGICPPVGAT